jgi:hypothetical protein
MSYDPMSDDPFTLHQGKPVQPTKDPADDGPEIFIIRSFRGRSAEWYRIIITAARIVQDAETAHIIHVECAFARKVGSLVD